jgi:hypothetical protein
MEVRHVVVEQLRPNAVDVFWADDDVCVHGDLLDGNDLHYACHAPS